MIDIRVVMGVLYLIAFLGFLGGLMANTSEVRFVLMGVVLAFLYPTMLLLTYCITRRLNKPKENDEDGEEEIEAQSRRA